MAGAWAGVLVFCGLAAAVVIAKPLADLWALHQQDSSPGRRRVAALAMSRRSSQAFQAIRVAMADTATAPTIARKRAARGRIVDTQKVFSRELDAASHASPTRGPELRRLKTRGEALIVRDCAPWTQSDEILASSRVSLKSRLLYFKNCVAPAASFQQSLDDQISILVADIIAAGAPPKASASAPSRARGQTEPFS